MRILLVEDEVGIAAFLVQGLEEEGFHVQHSPSGDAGLDLALHNDYDILLLDWMLPRRSGLEICSEFRKVNKTTPIIFLTAKDTLEETLVGLQTGANDYIKKPFHFSELLERIKVQLRNKPETTQVLDLADIQVSLASRQVSRSGREIMLTQKEFDLLVYLLQNKGQVCTRTKIIQEVWDIHFEYNTGVIDVYINALRKKLKLNDFDKHIQTIRGVGYLAKE